MKTRLTKPSGAKRSPMTGLCVSSKSSAKARPFSTSTIPTSAVASRSRSARRSPAGCRRSRPQGLGPVPSMLSNDAITSGICGQRNRFQGAVCTAAIPSRSCPLWVISGHRKGSAECPLYPQKRTLIERVRMCALCQKRTCVSGLSACQNSLIDDLIDLCS